MRRLSAAPVVPYASSQFLVTDLVQEILVALFWLLHVIFIESLVKGRRKETVTGPCLGMTQVFPQVSSLPGRTAGCEHKLWDVSSSFLFFLPLCPLFGWTGGSCSAGGLPLSPSPSHPVASGWGVPHLVAGACGASPGGLQTACAESPREASLSRWGAAVFPTTGWGDAFLSSLLCCGCVSSFFVFTAQSWKRRRQSVEPCLSPWVQPGGARCVHTATRGQCRRVAGRALAPGVKISREL